jgi:hypothetical protein
VKLRLVCGLLCCASLLVFGQDSSDQQNPPPQQQTPPSAPATPPSTKPTVQMPPAQPGQPAVSPTPVRDTEGDEISIMPFYWMTSAQPHMLQARGSTVTQPGTYDFPKDKNYALGAVLTVPTGHENSLQFTYFRKQSQGNQTLTQDQVYFGNFFASGDTVAGRYTMQYMKLSWNYLAYPYPPAGAKFRFKTLFEVQYVGMDAGFDAPADANAITTQGRKNLILPALGAGIEYHLLPHVVFEAKASGFGILHHADLWDAEANLIVHASHLELLVGGKAFHFKTSPNGDNYFYMTMYGPYAGLRYNFK